jgi:hypothetical protein
MSAVSFTYVSLFLILKSRYTVLRSMWVSAKFVTCTVKGTLVEAKMCTFTIESTHFFFNKCPIHTQDGASAKFSTNSQDPDYSVDSNLGCSSRQAWSINFFICEIRLVLFGILQYFSQGVLSGLYSLHNLLVYIGKILFWFLTRCPYLPSNPLRKVETKAKACSREKFPNCHFSGPV